MVKGIKGCASVTDLEHLVNPSGRYYKLNLHALNKYGTVSGGLFLCRALQRGLRGAQGSSQQGSALLLAPDPWRCLFHSIQVGFLPRRPCSTE